MTPAAQVKSGHYRIEYAPRQLFVPFHDRTQRFAAMVAHRRGGTTVACVHDLIHRAVLNPVPHARYAYVAPVLSQGKEIAWDYLKRYADPILLDKNEGELWVQLVNGARIRVHGADNPDRLRGGYLDGAVLDEYADMRPSVWGEVIRPMLADRAGWATFIGTPKGKNGFHDIYTRAQQDQEWFTARYRASETGLLPQSELDAARRDMTPEQYDQEFECSFDAAILGAYYGRDIAEAERAGRVCQLPVERGVPIQSAWDLGIHDSTAVWIFQVVANEIRVLDYIETQGKSLPETLALIETHGWRQRIDWLPHDAKVRELGTGKTRIEVLEACGCKDIRLVPMHEVMDGINAARVSMPLMWWEIRTCSEGIEALRQYRSEWDERKRIFSNKPRHDWTSHAADAFRYLAMAWKEQARSDKPPPKPIAKQIDQLTMDEYMAVEDRPRGMERI